MAADVVPLSMALRKRLVRSGARVAEANALVPVPASGQVTTDQFFLFWETVGASSPPDVGLRLAAETQVHEYDLSSLAALHSPDIGTALRKVARYKRLCGPKDMTLESRAHELRIHSTWLHASRPTPPRLVDASLASLLVLLQRGSGRTLAPKRIELARPPSDEPLLRRFFGAPIRFRAARDVLVLDEALLETPFVTHNADLLDALVPGLEAKLRPPSQSFVDEVRDVLARGMSGDRPSVQKTARALAVSSRTLQRRLGEHGVRYQDLLDEVRHATSVRLLRAKELDPNEIAFLLGFEELNSFARAFVRWEGTTPRRWRDSKEHWHDRMSGPTARA